MIPPTNVPQELRYTKTHEWARSTPSEVTVGITAHAQEELRDVVYVELPAVGRAVQRGEPVAVVESVKAAFDIYAPLSGTITSVNDALRNHPKLVNEDCYGKGWFFALKPGQPQESHALLSAQDYAALIQTSAH
jgi:glycine cleavage system H protein